MQQGRQFQLLEKRKNKAFPQKKKNFKIKTHINCMSYDLF